MLCWLNGRLLPVDQARVPVLDRGLLYGDSLFETLRVQAGHLRHLDWHLERFLCAANRLAFDVPVSRSVIVEACAELLTANAVEESVLRLTLTRGIGTRGANPSSAHSPILLIMQFPLPADLEARRGRGYRVALSPWRKVPPEALPSFAKHGNYLNSIVAMQHAAASGADEALLLDAAGDVCEGSQSNIFFVFEETLVTPHLASGVLPGIARAVVIAQAAQAGIHVVERKVALDETRRVDEAFITSSVLGVMPVSRLLEKELPIPGEVTARLMRLYARAAD